VTPDYSSLLDALNAVGPSVDTTPMAPAPSDGSSQVPAGVVPQFQPAPNLVQHHSLLSRIGTAIQNGVGKYSAAIAPIDPALAQNLSPAQLQFIRQQALRNSGLAMLDRQPDRQGFMPSTLQSIARGLGAARDTAAQGTQSSIQANQYNTQQAQAQHVQATRAQIEAGLSQRIQAETDPAKQLDLIEDAGVKSAAAGDLDAAAKYAALAKSVREGRASNLGPNFEKIDLGDRWGFFNPKTHETFELDGVTPVTDGTKQISLAQKAAGDRQLRGQDITQTDHNDTSDLSFAKSFMTDTADLRKENVAFNAFKTIAGRSAAGSPEAYKSAIINYMGALDPKAQVRSKMLEFASKVDPSIKGQYATFVQRLKDGTFPVEQLQGMVDVANASHQSYRKQYQAKYQEYSTLHPSSTRYLPRTDAEFLDASKPELSTPAASTAPVTNPFR